MESESNQSHAISRRGFLAATGIAGCAATLTSLAPLARAAQATGEHGHGVVVPPSRRGIILYTVRDVVSRAPDPAQGVGGGFRYVFEQLSAMGYRQIEFAGYTQDVSILGRQIKAAEIRQLLDDNGLVANGSHIGINFDDPGSFEAQLDVAQTLGMPHLGTPSIPTSSRYKSDWARAADNFNTFGALAAKRDIKLYQHNHHAEYNFLLDAGAPDANGNPTASSGLRGLEYFFTRVDPRLVWFEMDIYWGYVAQHRYQNYIDANGVSRVDIFDPISTVADRSHQFPLFHVKDGIRADNADGYSFVPAGTGAIPLREFLQKVGKKGYHFPNYEQDNAPGPDEQSLRDSQISYRNIAGWRG